MATIKFRAKERFTGKTIFSTGILQDYSDGGVLRGLYDEEREQWRLVYPYSVAQLVGYDSNGAEVYDDDTLVDAAGNEFAVSSLRFETNKFALKKISGGETYD